MKWCCSGLEGCFENTGQRGFSVIVSRRSHEGNGVFYLQARAVADGDPDPGPSPAPFTMVSQVAIRYCPWCGEDLRDFYREDLASMAERAGRYIFDPFGPDSK
jgi:hypothetical protein